jgi:hypothetical protein
VSGILLANRQEAKKLVIFANAKAKGKQPTRAVLEVVASQTLCKNLI